MRATVHHRGHGTHTFVQPAVLRVATIALALCAATVPASAAMASQTAPGSTTAETAKTIAETAKENPSGVADLLRPLGHTWGN
ncbi:hypothetical protein ACWGQT_09245 [Streptomyces yangpuensis]|uniref:hypothetical protein n=1 Tax=Streptomyces TaxID=1883 RepID=UPI001600ED27|nr:hypothetical protein [Streptomyces sp. gCLA4]MBZ9596755.1 hypothetical protein [Streptomyces erythrochromogenes]